MEKLPESASSGSGLIKILPKSSINVSLPKSSINVSLPKSSINVPPKPLINNPPKPLISGPPKPSANAAQEKPIKPAPVKNRKIDTYPVSSDYDVYLAITRASYNDLPKRPDLLYKDVRLSPNKPITESYSSLVIAAYSYNFPYKLYKYGAIPHWFILNHPSINAAHQNRTAKSSLVYIIHVTHMLVQLYCSLAKFHDYFSDENTHLMFYKFASIYLNETASFSQMVLYGRKKMPRLFTDEWSKSFKLEPCTHPQCLSLCFTFVSEHKGLRPVWRDHTGFNFGTRCASTVCMTAEYKKYLQDELGDYDQYTDDEIKEWSAKMQLTKMSNALSMELADIFPPQIIEEPKRAKIVKAPESAISGEFSTINTSFITGRKYKPIAPSDLPDLIDLNELTQSLGFNLSAFKGSNTKSAFSKSQIATICTDSLTSVYSDEKDDDPDYIPGK